MQFICGINCDLQIVLSLSIPQLRKMKFLIVLIVSQLFFREAVPAESKVFTHSILFFFAQNIPIFFLVSENKLEECEEPIKQNPTFMNLFIFDFSNIIFDNHSLTIILTSVGIKN